jgi:hypothetical protein
MSAFHPKATEQRTPAQPEIFQRQPDLGADDHVRRFELLQDASDILFRFAVAVLDRGGEVVHAGGDRPCDGALLVEWIAAHHQSADRAAAEAEHRELHSGAPKYSHLHRCSSACVSRIAAKIAGRHADPAYEKAT